MRCRQTYRAHLRDSGHGERDAVLSPCSSQAGRGREEAVAVVAVMVVLLYSTPTGSVIVLYRTLLLSDPGCTTNALSTDCGGGPLVPLRQFRALPLSPRHPHPLHHTPMNCHCTTDGLLWLCPDGSSAPARMSSVTHAAKRPAAVSQVSPSALPSRRMMGGRYQ